MVKYGLKLETSTVDLKHHNMKSYLFQNEISADFDRKNSSFKRKW